MSCYSSNMHTVAVDNSQLSRKTEHPLVTSPLIEQHVLDNSAGK
jgi:hypothetical protein